MLYLQNTFRSQPLLSPKSKPYLLIWILAIISNSSSPCLHSLPPLPSSQHSNQSDHLKVDPKPLVACPLSLLLGWCNGLKSRAQCSAPSLSSHFTSHSSFQPHSPSGLKLIKLTSPLGSYVHCPWAWRTLLSSRAAWLPFFFQVLCCLLREAFSVHFLYYRTLLSPPSILSPCSSSVLHISDICFHNQS